LLVSSDFLMQTLNFAVALSLVEAPWIQDIAAAARASSVGAGAAAASLALPFDGFLLPTARATRRCAAGRGLT
jgi:hypothetical protein